MSQDTYLTIDETAKRLGVSDDTVRRLMNQGTLPSIRLGHRTVRISLHALDKYMACMSKNGNA